MHDRESARCAIVARRDQLVAEMSPSSLLHVSPDLMRERARAGAPELLTAAASDRAWTIGFAFAFLAAIALVYLALR